jgi:phosphatidate cytidylyltransferase
VSNLTQRVLVALVAIPLIVTLSILGGFFFFAMIVFIASLGLYEYYKLAEAKGASPQTLVGLVFGFFICTVFIWERLQTPLSSLSPTFGCYIPNLSMSELLLALLLSFIPFILLLEMFRNKGSAMINSATTIVGVVYVSLFLGSFIGLRELFAAKPLSVAQFPDVSGTTNMHNGWGGSIVLTVFVAIWMCDSLAYFAGRLFGKHKLFERVSPNKTWEGAIAGYIGAVATFLVSQHFFLPLMSAGAALVCGSIVGIFGQLGDLAESLLKRDTGVKDSSALIPGHGGVLDRFDSLMFVSPLLYLYLRFVVF